MAIKLIATNKKAYQNFNLTEKWECGIVLTGGEVKSIRSGHVNFKDTYAWVKEEEVYLSSLHVEPYLQAHTYTEPDRVRKLLLHKKEIKRIAGHLTAQSRTLIPTRLYFNARGIIKIEIAIGVGKKLYDKRDDIKKRDLDREVGRAMRRRK
jgi:SsrA-binding protein